MTTMLAPPPETAATRPHRLSGGGRRRAVAVVTELDPGRYLAVHADGEVVVLPLTAAVTRIGRAAGSDVRFDDASVSRRHAMVLDRDGVAVLVDDRSMNGTWLNGHRVSAAPLRHGDTIVLGDIRLAYLEVTEAPTRAAA